MYVKASSGNSKSTGVNNTGTIEGVAAELKSYGGNIYGMAVNNEGRVSATSVTSSGGQIFLSSGSGGMIKSTGSLTATKSSGSEGGEVTILAKQGTAEIGGNIDASGSNSGGEILLLGNVIEVMPDTVLLADGDLAGGSVMIGGGVRGLDPNFENATTTTIGKGAFIDVSARNNGDGGTAVFFAEKTLNFYGFASAQGGMESGNGGFVELSGKESVSFNGFVNSADVSAKNGKGGLLLFDPINVVIIPRRIHR